jgi:hypothetical protein
VYLGELALNGNSMPVGRLKFWLTGRVPGLRINSVYARSLGPAVQTAAREVLDALSGDPAIVLSHGAPLVGPGDAARVRKLVQPLDRSAAR